MEENPKLIGFFFLNTKRVEYHWLYGLEQTLSFCKVKSKQKSEQFFKVKILKRKKKWSKANNWDSKTFVLLTIDIFQWKQTTDQP